MALQSKLFRGDPQLEAAAVSDPAHITIGARGEHVRKIQIALNVLDGANIAPDGTFGAATAAAILAYKRKRDIINRSYQTQADNIVGKMTIAALDAELLKKPPAPPPTPGPSHEQVIKNAFEASRQATRSVHLLLQRLRADIDRVERLDGPEKIIALTNLVRNNARNIAVVSKRFLVSQEPLSSEFRDALAKTIDLLGQNLSQSSTIIDEQDIGRCKRENFNPPGVPFAATTVADPDPRVSVCTPFFTSNPELQRDVITHEFFHLVGLADIKLVATTSDALKNANTLAQVVAWLNDRLRQKNSDGHEEAIPPLPAP